MADKPTQRTISFDQPAQSHAASVRYEPSDDALAAFERLEDWLLDGAGNPKTELGRETLHALAKALLEGKKGFWHHAEGMLEAILPSPIGVAGEINPAQEKEFRQAVDDLLDCLHERMLGRESARVAGWEL